MRGSGATKSAVRPGAVDREPGRVDAPSVELLAGQRTAALNALRGHLAEIGVVAPQGAQHAYGLKGMAADGFNENREIVVPDCVRGALRPLVGRLTRSTRDAQRKTVKIQVQADRGRAGFCRSELAPEPARDALTSQFRQFRVRKKRTFMRSETGWRLEIPFGCMVESLLRFRSDSFTPRP